MGFLKKLLNAGGGLCDAGTGLGDEMAMDGDMRKDSHVSGRSSTMSGLSGYITAEEPPTPASRKSTKGLIGRTVNGVPVLGSSEKFDDIDQKSYRAVEGAANLTEGWTLHTVTNSGIHVYTKPSDFGGGAKQVCGKARVDCSPEEFLKEISNYDNWPKWDPVLKSHHEKELELGHTLIRLELHGMFPVSGRETVYLESKIINEEDMSIAFAGYSIEHEDWPITKKLVRAEVQGGGWHIKPVQDEPNQCDVSYVMNVDPKLKLVPAFIMNLAVVRFPGIIDKVRKGLGCNIPNGKGTYYSYPAIESVPKRRSRRLSSLSAR